MAQAYDKRMQEEHRCGRQFALGCSISLALPRQPTKHHLANVAHAFLSFFANCAEPTVLGVYINKLLFWWFVACLWWGRGNKEVCAYINLRISELTIMQFPRTRRHNRNSYILKSIIFQNFICFQGALDHFTRN